MKFNVYDISGIQTGFEYIELTKVMEEKQLIKYANRQKTKASESTKNWSKEKSIEWTVRNYLSLKMLLASTLTLNSAEFTNERNVKIVEFYLYYYSLLNTSRALLFADPTVIWNGGGLIGLPHLTIINMVYESLRLLSKEVATEVRELLIQNKNYRELFSYRFPANGHSTLFGNAQLKVDLDLIKRTCRLIAEVAQFNSEIMECSGEKNISNPNNYNLTRRDFEIGYKYPGLDKNNTSDQDVWIDDEDIYRLGYYVRKNIKRPWNIYHSAREGLVEDFFGAWSTESDEEDCFDPDKNINILISPL